MTLAAAVALLLLVIVPSMASASITNFELKRVNSNPEFTFAPGAAAFASLVASPLGYPSAVGPVVGLGEGACGPAHVFATGQVTPNTIADDCDAFLRVVDGRHEDSPGAFPGMQITEEYDPTGPAPTKTLIHPPRGQLGSPFSAHQCDLSPRACNGLEPAFSAAVFGPAGVDDDQTEADGAKVGNVTFFTKAGVCQLGCGGEIINYDPRGLTNPDERGASAAQAIVLCQTPKSLAPGVLPTFCAGNPLNPTVAGGNVVFAQAGPIDVVPDPDHEGDYQLESSIDFTKLEGAAAGEQITKIVINEFGLVRQSAADPRQIPTARANTLPAVINPTTSVTAVSRSNADFADGSTDTKTFQTFPRTGDPVPDDVERAWVEEETKGYPWNGKEIDPENSTGGAAQHVVTRDQPTNKLGNTLVNNFDKVAGDSKDVPVETPSSLAAQFTSPTRSGLPYQSHYSEIDLLLKDTTLSPTLAGRPNFKICTPEQFDRGAFEGQNCPQDSQIADLKAVSPLADGDLGPIPCHSFTECSKVNVFVFAKHGCQDANANPEAPCDNLTRHFDPADFPGGNPGANLDPFGGDVFAGPQVQGHPNQFRIFAELRNSPSCLLNTPGSTNAALCAEGSDVKPRLHVKLEGVATANLETGEVQARFTDLPELPVFDVTQSFPGGDFATTTSPIECGDHKFAGEITPFAAIHGDDTVTDSPPKAQPDDTITTVAAPNAPCSSDANARGAREAAPSHGFNPELSFLSDPFTAGQDTAFTTSIKLADRSDNLTDTSVSLPDGVLAPLTSVPMCGRDLARAGNCPDSSQIGTVDVAQGNGGSPLHVPGKVYFSQPGGDGELARITVVVPAKVGPFDLQQTIVNELAVRLRQNGGGLGLDNTGVDKLPTIVSGIPIRIREINLRIDRGGFIRNPLNCNTLTGSGTFGSAGGQSAKPTGSFKATGCDSLAFTPRLGATVGSGASPAKVGAHPALTTVVTQPDHQASIQKAVVSLPKGLFANVEAVTGGLCSRQQLAADACPATSKVGSAEAGPPLLPEPLTGPLYLVDNPGGLPHLVVRLTGLIAQDLEASTSITQDGRLITTFDGLPNLPVSSFALNIAGGARGLFTVGSALCTNPVANATFTSHTGQSAKDDAPVKLVGNCVPAASPLSANRPSLSLSVRRVKSTPLMTVKARKASGGANLRTVRIALPSALVVNAKRLKNGVTVTAGGKRLKKSAWTLSRRGVLTIRTAKKGTSIIAATFQSGSLKTSATLRKAAKGRKTLKRLSFAARVIDAKSKQFNYSLKVRPLR